MYMEMVMGTKEDYGIRVIGDSILVGVIDSRTLIANRAPVHLSAEEVDTVVDLMVDRCLTLILIILIIKIRTTGDKVVNGMGIENEMRRFSTLDILIIIDPKIKGDEVDIATRI